jgi:hypothetical protein
VWPNPPLPPGPTHDIVLYNSWRLYNAKGTTIIVNRTRNVINNIIIETEWRLSTLYRNMLEHGDMTHLASTYFYRNCKTNLACTYNALQCICECQDTDPRKLHCWQAHCSWTVTHIWNKNVNSLQLKTERTKKRKKYKTLCSFTTSPTLHNFKTWDEINENKISKFIWLFWGVGVWGTAYSNNNVYLTKPHMRRFAAAEQFWTQTQSPLSSSPFDRSMTAQSAHV